jgi:hypothetical protein
LPGTMLAVYGWGCRRARARRCRSVEAQGGAHRTWLLLNR